MYLNAYELPSTYTQQCAIINITYTRCGTISYYKGMNWLGKHHSVTRFNGG